MRVVQITWGPNRELVAQLSEWRVRFFVAGGTATRFRAPERREPNDLDLLVEPSLGTLEKLNAALAYVGAPIITATPEQFATAGRQYRDRTVLNVDILTPPTGVCFSEHWEATEEAIMSCSQARVHVASMATLVLLLRIGQEREPSRAQAFAKDLDLLSRANDLPGENRTS
jgi:hypothetical protein